MWHLPSTDGVNDLASRIALGVGAVWAPQQAGLGFSTIYAGAEADVRPLAAPLFGRIEPVVTLGAGALRTDVERVGAARAPLAASTNTTFVLSPGIGARLAIGRGLAIRGDVRDMVTFRHDTRHNLAFNAGLSLTF